MIITIANEIEENIIILLFLRKTNKNNRAKKYVAKAILSPEAKQTKPIKLR